MAHQRLEALRKKHGGTLEAIEQYIVEKHLSLDIKHIPSLAKVAHELYDELCNIGRSREQAWDQCEKFIQKQVKEHGKSKTPSVFDRFANMAGADEQEKRDRSAQAHSSTQYRTEERHPSGLHWAHGESYPHRRPQPSRAVPSRGAFYYTEERKPGGQSYSKDSTAGSGAPPHYSARGSYNTKEFRPEGSFRPFGASDDPKVRAKFNTRYAHDARNAYHAGKGYNARSNSPPPLPPAADTSDPYVLLGVSRSASAEEINKAYKKLCLKYHPDKVPPAEREKATKRFQEINQAKGMLLDEKKRAEYDREFRRR